MSCGGEWDEWIEDHGHYCPYCPVEMAEVVVLGVHAEELVAEIERMRWWFSKQLTCDRECSQLEQYELINPEWIDANRLGWPESPVLYKVGEGEV